MKINNDGNLKEIINVIEYIPSDDRGSMQNMCDGCKQRFDFNKTVYQVEIKCDDTNHRFIHLCRDCFYHKVYIG